MAPWLPTLTPEGTCTTPSLSWKRQASGGVARLPLNTPGSRGKTKVAMRGVATKGVVTTGVAMVGVVMDGVAGYKVGGLLWCKEMLSSEWCWVHIRLVIITTPLSLDRTSKW